jgi:hypothetical protein
MNYPPKFSDVNYANIAREIDANNHAVVQRVIPAGNVDNVPWNVDRVEAPLKELVAQKKRLLFGVTFEDLIAQAYKSLAISRACGNPMDLLWDMVLGVFLCYTVSREWANVYQTLSNRSVYKPFEIDNRTVDVTTEIGRRSQWVTASRMNATAVHYLGYLVVDACRPGGALAKIKMERGTCFAPVAGPSEQAKIMGLLAASVTPEVRALQPDFKIQMQVLVDVVDRILSHSTINVAAVLACANAYRPAEF